MLLRTTNIIMRYSTDWCCVVAVLLVTALTGGVDGR